MEEDTKQAIELALQILRKTLIEQGVSLAVAKETGDLNFFDTETYMRTGKFDGIKISIDKLVK